jgi:hypothetical protein
VDTHLFAFMDLPRGRGRERRRGRERLKKRRRGTKTPPIAGIVCLKATDQSGQHCDNRQKHFLTGFLLACLLPQSSSSSFSAFSLRRGTETRPWTQEGNRALRRVPGDTHLFAFMDLPRGRRRERRRGRERLGKEGSRKSDGGNGCMVPEAIVDRGRWTRKGLPMRCS